MPGRSWTNHLSAWAARFRVGRLFHVKRQIETLVAVLGTLQRRHELGVGKQRRAVDVTHHVGRGFGKSLDVNLATVEFEFRKPGALRKNSCHLLQDAKQKGCP